MKQLVLSVLGSAILATVSGCSSSVAAPVQHVPTQPQVAISLAPQGDLITDNPIKIPEGRKTPQPAVVKPVTFVSKNQDVIESEEGMSPDPMPEQDRKQDKQDKTNRRNGMRQEGRQFDKKQDENQRLDRFEKLQVVKKPADEPSKPTAPAPLAIKVEASLANTQGSPAPDSATSTSTTLAPGSVVVPAATTPTVPTSPASFSITYGSAASATSRNFKKPSLPSGLPSWYTDNDKDGDGQLSMNEWPSDRYEEFSKYDRNGDGIITIEEAMKTVPKAVVVAPSAPAASAPVAVPAASVPASPPKVVASANSPAPTTAGTPMSEDDAKRSVDRILPFVDLNKDGMLDESEIEKTRSIKSMDWKKYDANRDGKLDKNEMIALFKVEGSSMQRGMGGGGWGNMSPDDRAKMMFDNMDKSKTGKINKEQFPGFWRDRFVEFDTNKDGFVDLEEFKVASAKMMPGGGRGGPGGGGPGGGRGGPGGGGGDNGGRGGRGGDNGGRGGRGGFGGGNG